MNPVYVVKKDLEEQLQHIDRYAGVSLDEVLALWDKHGFVVKNDDGGFYQTVLIEVPCVVIDMDAEKVLEHLSTNDAEKSERGKMWDDDGKRKS